MILVSRCSKKVALSTQQVRLGGGSKNLRAMHRGLMRHQNVGLTISLIGVDAHDCADYPA
jgi:hypothetical protein